jgi:protein O-mannosyl-transferase
MPVTNPDRDLKQPDNKLIFLSFLVFAFALYANTLNSGFVLDDTIVIDENKSVQKGIRGVAEIFTEGGIFINPFSNQQIYRPVTFTTFAITKTLCNNAPIVEHCINVILYGLTGILIFQVMSFWFPGLHFSIKVFSVLIFMAHPVHTEVIANIKSRDEILCLMFALSSLLLLHQYLENGRLIMLISSAAVFILSVLSKENGVTFIVLFPLSLYFFGNRSLKNVFVPILPHFALLILYVLLRNMIMPGGMDKAAGNIEENILLGAENSSQFTATLTAILGKYLKLLVIPYPLSWDYSYNQIPLVSWINLSSVVSLIIYAVLAFIAIKGFRKKELFSFLILFYLITLSVYSNILFVNSVAFAERFLYMPSLAFCAGIPILLYKISGTDLTKFKGQYKAILIGTLALIIILGSAFTVARNRDWKSNRDLFEAGVQTSPKSFKAHNHLARTYQLMAEQSTDPDFRKKLQSKALYEFRLSLSIYPQNYEASYNMGVILSETGDPAAATQAYLTAIAVIPNHFMALTNLGQIYLYQNNFDLAYHCFKRAIEAKPDNYQAFTNMGALFHIQKEYEEAIKNYEKAIQLNPYYSIPYDNLIKIYKALNNPEKVDFYVKKRSLNTGHHSN